MNPRESRAAGKESDAASDAPDTPAEIGEGGHRHPEAVETSDAHALDPDNPDICNSIGVLLRRSGRPEEALVWFDRALGLRPDFFAATNKKVSALVDLGRIDEALAISLKVMAADRNNAEAEFNVGFLQLLRGNFEVGWVRREARWRLPAGQAPVNYNFPQPLWLGKEPIAGKTILVHQDEGQGDTIQFVRYVPMLAALGARVVLLVGDALVPLLSGVEGVSQCVPKSADAYLSFDLYCPITTLPLAFGTRMDTIPSRTPYLTPPDVDRVLAWEQRLPAHARMRVGLVWSGNPGQSNDQNRSTTLRTLLPLLDLDATFVSLQKDPRPEDRALLAETGIVDVTAHLTDFAETAALMSRLDLLISVCTSTAHLAGALARPTWIMLCAAPDYRWLLHRDDSPWYPTARLFRQTRLGDYTSVVACMRTELAQRIAAWSPPAAIDATTLYAAALAAMRAGRHAEAKACCRLALAQSPDHADTLHLMGLLSLEHHRYDQAAEWLSRAIRIDARPLYLRSLGTALLNQGRREEALQVIDRAVQLKPDDADLWRNLGDALVELDRPQDAIPSYQHALELDPRHLDAARKAGILLQEAGREEEALACFNLSEELERDHLPIIRRRALTLANLQRFEEALADNRRALELDPASADTCENTGNVLRALSRHEEAIAWYDRALALRPDLATTLDNKAVALAELHRFDQAIATSRLAIAADPTYAVARWNLALVQLLTGNFAAGWAGREARWEIPFFSRAYPKLSAPMWLGAEPVTGKTVLVCAEEGFGDSIQFVRYVPMLAARGARVILVVQDSLCAWFAGVEGVAQCLPKSNPVLPDCDFHCPMSSLPFAFGTSIETIPAGTSYLRAPAEPVQAWEQRLGAHDRLRVGLVWSGNPRHSNDRNRSVPLRALAPLLDLDASFVSLQKDARSDDRAFLAERSEIVDFTAELADFAGTAALISCLDLVITVDTSVAHLAGALGCSTWILLPFTPDYRWLLDRDDSPWYPTVRLFRQRELGDYAGVVARVRTELADRIAARSRRPPGAGAPVDAATALFGAALAKMRAGRHAEAESCCLQALAQHPDHADTLHLMGLLALGHQQYDQAAEWLSRAIRSDGKPLYLRSLGTVLLKQGRHAEALQIIDRAVQLQPDEPDLWRNRGDALVGLDRPQDAIPSYQRVLGLNPHHFDAAYKLALLLHQAGRDEEALGWFDRCAKLQGDHFQSTYMRAHALQSLKRFEEALEASRRAVALDPASAAACDNTGNMLRALSRHEEAIAWYDRALALRPDFAASLANKAVALAELHRFDEAVVANRQALAIDPGYAAAAWNLSQLQLLRGDFEAGWAGQEARWKIPNLSSGYPKLSQPKWLGAEPVAGKTILVGANEGIGDAIQFVRYVPMLAARGARVILVVPDSVVPLLAGIEGVAQCLPRSRQELPDFELHVPLSSLPLAFATRLDTIPADVPYLPAPAAEHVRGWENRLGAHDRMRVGLVWAGNPRHNNDRNRSLPLRRLAPLFDFDVAFISLQKDPRPDDRALLAERQEIGDFTADLTDFAETAALISCLDLVITVDTSVAHLAGALGCPTWILLPFTPDFRWLLDRDDSPWYPTARLFRQTRAGDYESVIERVRRELRAQIAAAGKNGDSRP